MEIDLNSQAEFFFLPKQTSSYTLYIHYIWYSFSYTHYKFIIGTVQCTPKKTTFSSKSALSFNILKREKSKTVSMEIDLNIFNKKYYTWRLF